MRFFVLLFSALFFSSSAVSAQELIPDPALIQRQLPNGLTYYIYQTDRTKDEAYFRLFVKVGSVQETEDQRGLAHFLEHMAFNGIKGFKGNELINFLETKGAQFGHDINAHTSFSETIYKLKVPTSSKGTVDSTLSILAGWADGILLDSLEIEKERGVVLSEWLTKQNPQLKAQKAFLEKLLNGSHYSRREVIGDTLILKTFKPEDLESFYNQWYDPSLMAVAVAGDINVEEVERLIIEKFSPIKSSNPSIKTYEIAGYEDIGVKVLTDKHIKNPELNIIQLIDPLKDINNEKTYKAYLLRSIANKLFAERFSSSLFDNAPYKKASISTGNFLPVKGAHIATVYLSPDSIQAGINSFLTQLNQIYRHGFTTLEIEKVKKEYLNAFEKKINSKDPPSGNLLVEEMHRNFFYNNSIITVEEEYKLAQKYLAALDSVAIADFVSSFDNPEKSHYLLTANENIKEELPDSLQLLNKVERIRDKEIARFANQFHVPQKLLKRDPVPGKIISRDSIPEIEATSFTLSNGMTIIYKQTDFDKDKIILSGFRKGGLYALDSTDYISGIYTSPVISASGYGDFSREALSYYLAGNSAKAVMLIDNSRTGFYATSSVRDIDTLFELLYLKWKRPRVDSLVFNEIKSRTISDLKNKNYSASENFSHDLKKVIRGDNYVTRRMTPEVIEEQLSEENISTLYNKFFGSANGFTVSILSDQPFSTLKPYILKYLGGLPAGPADTRFRFNPSKPIESDIDFIKRTGDSPRAIVSLVFQQNETIDNLQEQGFKNDLAERVLRAKLLKRLREELGGVYSVSVSISSTNVPNSLSRQTIGFVCDPERVDELVAETRQILAHVAAGEVDFSSEVEKVKTNFIKKYEDSIERNSHWTKSIRDYYYYDYKNWDHAVGFEERMEGITHHDVSQIVEKYFIQSPMIKAVLYPREGVKQKNN